MKQRTKEILRNGKKPKKNLETRNFAPKQQQTTIFNVDKKEESKQEMLPTKQSRVYDVTDMTNFSMPYRVFSNNLKIKAPKMLVTPSKESYESGCSPP